MLEYKIINYPYYKDVQLNLYAIHAFPEQPANIYFLLHSVSSSSTEYDELIIHYDYDPDVIVTPLDFQPSSFIPTRPNSHTKLERM